MGRFSVEDHIIFCCRERAMASRNYHCRIVLFLICHMRADQVIHTVKMPVINDGFRTADTLFCRLEDQLHRAAQFVPVRRQNVRDAQTDGRVAVVAAASSRRKEANMVSAHWAKAPASPLSRK